MAKDIQRVVLQLPFGQSSSREVVVTDDPEAIISQALLEELAKHPELDDQLPEGVLRSVKGLRQIQEAPKAEEPAEVEEHPEAPAEPSEEVPVEEKKGKRGKRNG